MPARSPDLHILYGPLEWNKLFQAFFLYEIRGFHFSDDLLHVFFFFPGIDSIGFVNHAYEAGNISPRDPKPYVSVRVLQDFFYPLDLCMRELQRTQTDNINRGFTNKFIF